MNTHKAYLEAAIEFGRWSRDLKLIYSPLHGVGSFAVLPLLIAAGFKDVIEYAPHAEPSGDFPNVPGHVSNPENRVVFDAMIDEARRSKRISSWLLISIVTEWAVLLL